MDLYEKIVKENITYMGRYLEVGKTYVNPYGIRFVYTGHLHKCPHWVKEHRYKGHKLSLTA